MSVCVACVEAVFVRACVCERVCVSVGVCMCVHVFTVRCLCPISRSTMHSVVFSGTQGRVEIISTGPFVGCLCGHVCVLGVCVSVCPSAHCLSVHAFHDHSVSLPLSRPQALMPF